MNRGAAELRATLRKRGASQAEVGEALGVSQAAVQHWTGGAKKPRLEMRQRIAERYGVPVEAWEEPAPVAPPSPAVENPDTSPPPAAVAKGEASPGELVGDGEPIPADFEGMGDWLERRVHDLLERISSDPLATPLEQMRGYKLAATALADKAKSRQLTPAQIMKSEGWRQIVAAMTRALGPHPAAAADVARELRALDEGAGSFAA